MKLDDYAEFNDEKPDEDYDEPSKKNGKKISVMTKVIMAFLIVAVLVLIAVAVLYSFTGEEETEISKIPVQTMEDKDKKESSSVVIAESESSSQEQETKESDANEITTEFLPDNSKVTAKDVVNLRSMPSTTNENCVILGTLSKGEVLTRTGISYEMGWSRLEYNGQVVYAVTSYLEVVK